MLVMKTVAARRPYAMRARAEAAERLSEQIIDAAYELWVERSYDEITLQEIADRARVSLSSVMRRFGSKEGVLEAIISTDRMGEGPLRASVAAGDVEAAIAALIDGYERIGDAVMRNIALEERLPAVADWVDLGRRFHRKWVGRVFAEWLPAPGTADYRRRRAQFIVATDLYTWKILRRDQGLSKQETALAMRDLVDRLIKED
jgi:AcrR family transcriptional regulator